MTDSLWAPWRLSYIKHDDGEKTPAGCFLCQYCDTPAEDEPHWVIDRGELTLTVLNRFPYNNGHLLIAPLAHKASLTELSDDEAFACTKQLQHWIARLTELMHPDGFNVGLNLGSAGGAGVPGHLHWHIVPRWSGDTNFMPVVGDVKVIPQSLQSLWELLTG
ncbi:MAG: HIT domain-containing protein [Planctomycetaceae bacterium]